MDGELASVRGTVDLSSQEALDKAEAFLTQKDTRACAVRKIPSQSSVGCRTKLRGRSCPG